jgi:hypothetical protein
MRFIAGADHKAVHNDGDPFRLKDANDKTYGKQQLETTVHGRNPTWSSDRSKLPDLVGFCIAEGIFQDFSVERSWFDISTDHYPVLITLKADGLSQEKQPTLNNIRGITMNSHALSTTDLY